MHAVLPSDTLPSAAPSPARVLLLLDGAQLVQNRCEDAYKVLSYLFASLSGALLWSKASCCLMFAVEAQTLRSVVHMT